MVPGMDWKTDTIFHSIFFNHELSAMHTCQSLSVILLIIVFGSPGFTQETSRLEIAGVSIAKKDPKAEFERSLSGFGAAGTAVDVFVNLPDQSILAIDEKKSKVVLSCDDGGELPLREQFDGLFALNVRDDKSTATIQLGSESLPGKTTTKLTLSGSLVLVVGKDKKTDNIDLKIVNNSKVKLGTIDAIVIVRGSNEDSGDPNSQTIELHSNRPFESIAALEFLDRSGEILESQAAGSGSWGSEGDITYSAAYFVQSAAKSLKVRVSYFGRTENVTLPVDLEFGPGL